MWLYNTVQHTIDHLFGSQLTSGDKIEIFPNECLYLSKGSRLDIAQTHHELGQTDERLSGSEEDCDSQTSNIVAESGRSVFGMFETEGWAKWLDKKRVALEIEPK